MGNCYFIPVEQGRARWTAAFTLLAWATLASSVYCASPGTVPTTRSTIQIGRFQFEGGTVFRDAQLDAVVRFAIAEAQQGRDATQSPDRIRAIAVAASRVSNAPVNATVEELEAARHALAVLYVDEGYITSGAIVPDQDASDGILTIRLVEGQFTDIHIHGADAGNNPRPLRFDTGYLNDRLRFAAGHVLNVQDLKDELELLREDRNIARVNAELRPSDKPGQSVLDMQLQEASPYHLSLDFNNQHAPSVGSERFEVLGSDTNLTGFDDPLNLQYTLNEGKLDDMRFAGLDEFGVDYTRPITPAHTTVQLAFSRSSEPVVEEPFKPLNISSRTDNYLITIRQPIYLKPDNEFALFLTGNVRDNTTSLLGQPFSISPGSVNGNSKVAAIRFGQEWMTRNQTRAISVRSTFSVGIDAFDSTLHSGNAPDSRFFAWQGQAQYLRQIGSNGIQLIARGALQATPDHLLSLEQLSIGGFDTVRGYRENEIVRDNGVTGSLEVRFPLIRRNENSLLELAPFFDIGYGWGDSIGGEENPVLSSAGIGLLAHPNKHVDFQLYWGHPFKDYHRTSDLQDLGIHFNLLLTAF